jgi:hypothetical protein
MILLITTAVIAIDGDRVEVVAFGADLGDALFGAGDL